MPLLRLTQRNILRDASVKCATHLLVVSLVCLILLGCNVSRPDQDNFLVDAKGIGGEVLAREFASDLKASLTTTTLSLPDSDQTKVFRLDGQDFTVILMPLPDDRCNPEASFHSTYHDQQFRIDLIYGGSPAGLREELKRKLESVAARLHTNIEKFEEC